jgi:hypothetical protein
MTLLATLALVAAGYSLPKAGFYLEPPAQKTIIQYTTVESLVVIPVVINDSIRVNLILDTGCRNLVLFGKKFLKDFTETKARPVQFSGLGAGKPVEGKLSIGNSIHIGDAVGVNIPVVIVPQKNLFTRFEGKVDGVIGYDLFSRFEVEISPGNKKVVLQAAEAYVYRENFTDIKIKVIDCKPVAQSFINIHGSEEALELMIDTGSSLELLIKVTDPKKITKYQVENLGVGLNGNINGVQTISDKLVVGNLALTHLQTGLMISEWHNYGSLGMQKLKHYIIVINYLKEKISIKPA